jgi:hypothetical protein
VGYGPGGFSGGASGSRTTAGGTKQSGGVKGNFKNPNNFSGGVSGSIGGGVGIGGSVSGGAGVERRDCCIENPGGKPQIIRGGQVCGYVEVGAEGFAGGVEAAGGIGKIGAKAVSAGASEKCRICNKCGGGGPVGECCTTLTAKGGDVGVQVWRFSASFTVFKHSRTVCTGSYDGVDDDGGKTTWGDWGVGAGPKYSPPAPK